MRAGHELSRSFPADAHQPDVRPVGSRNGWTPGAEGADRRTGVDYREEYVAYYTSFADADSPKLRDSNPSVVVIPGLGLFGFAKDKREARITTEFFVNAIHVMAGANALEGDQPQPAPCRRRRVPEQAKHFTSFHNYVALPRLEAFRIEYWALEEAKLQRMPAEREFSRKIALVVGGGSGIGRDVVLQLAQARRARRRGGLESAGRGGRGAGSREAVVK